MSRRADIILQYQIDPAEARRLVMVLKSYTRDIERMRYTLAEIKRWPSKARGVKDIKRYIRERHEDL